MQFVWLLSPSTLIFTELSPSLPNFLTSATFRVPYIQAKCFITLSQTLHFIYIFLHLENILEMHHHHSL